MAVWKGVKTKKKRSTVFHRSQSNLATYGMACHGRVIRQVRGLGGLCVTFGAGATGRVEISHRIPPRMGRPSRISQSLGSPPRTQRIFLPHPGESGCVRSLLFFRVRPSKPADIWLGGGDGVKGGEMQGKREGKGQKRSGKCRGEEEGFMDEEGWQWAGKKRKIEEHQGREVGGRKGGRTDLTE